MKTTVQIALFLVLSALPAFAQNKKLVERAIIPIESISNNKTQNGVGYFVVIYMTGLQTPYTVLVTQKALVKSAERVKFEFPIENGVSYPYVVSDISKYMYSTKSNDLILIPMAAITKELNAKDIKTEFVFIPESSLNEVGFSIDRTELEKLKKDWELSWKI